MLLKGTGNQAGTEHPSSRQDGVKKQEGLPVWSTWERTWLGDRYAT